MAGFFTACLLEHKTLESQVEQLFWVDYPEAASDGPAVHDL